MTGVLTKDDQILLLSHQEPTDTGRSWSRAHYVAYNVVDASKMDARPASCCRWRGATCRGIQLQVGFDGEDGLPVPRLVPEERVGNGGRAPNRRPGPKDFPIA